MFSRKPNYTKLRSSLNIVTTRLKILEKKKTELTQKSRKEIAEYLSSNKDDRARIRVEHIIRQDYLVEAMELLEMYCDLLLARFGLIRETGTVDPQLEEAIASVIWATPRLESEIIELKDVSKQFSHKYSKEFTEACRSNTLKNVSERLMHKLSVEAPSKALVEKYLIAIAKTYNVDFSPDESLLKEDETFLVDMSLDVNGSGICNVLPYPVSPSYVTHTPAEVPPLDIVPNDPPQASYSNYGFPNLPALPPALPPTSSVGEASANGEEVDFDDLSRRFENLKKRN